jgi:hypothetical protein
MDLNNDLFPEASNSNPESNKEHNIPKKTATGGNFKLSNKLAKGINVPITLFS